MNVWHLLDRAAEDPRGALIEPGPGAGRELDYVAARAAALALAQRLRDAGAAPGDRVAVLMHNSIEYWLAYFAAAAAGAILVPLNTRLTAADHRRVLAHSGATVLLHDDAHAVIAGELGIPRLRIDAASTGASSDVAPTLAGPDDPAQLYYTSGTTGAPKGVVLTHRNVCTHAESAIVELGLNGADRWAHIAPMFHLADAWAVFAITAVAGTHVFEPRFEPRRALDLLAEERITITNLVPTMLNLMVAEPGAQTRTYALRRMLSGGAAIAPETVQRILATFGDEGRAFEYVQTYGMTETSPYLTLSLLPKALRSLPAADRLRLVCRTGRPFRGVALRVTREDGSEVARDDVEVGEIRVRGATVTPGYWQNDEATAAAFDADGFLYTGDLATIDEHGFVNIVDRKKDVVNTGGELVYSIEVENTLHEHPAVLECAVFGRPDDVWGERVTAAVVLRADAAALDGDALIAFCRDRLAAYKVPKAIEFLATLPRTGSGKISKRALRES